MGDYFTSIVPVEINITDVSRKAQSIVSWLAKENIIKLEKTDCILSEEKGYPIHTGIKTIFEKPLSEEDYSNYKRLSINGFQVTTERNIYHTGQYDIDKVICPLCKYDNINGDWSDCFNSWIEGGGNSMACTSCLKSSNLNKYTFYVEGNNRWGLSNLGFTFWNMPYYNLNEKILSQMETIIGCEVHIVYGKL